MTDTDPPTPIRDLLDEAMSTHYSRTQMTYDRARQVLCGRSVCAGCGEPWPCLTHRLARCCSDLALGEDPDRG